MLVHNRRESWIELKWFIKCKLLNDGTEIVSNEYKEYGRDAGYTQGYAGLK